MKNLKCRSCVSRLQRFSNFNFRSEIENKSHLGQLSFTITYLREMIEAEVILDQTADQKRISDQAKLLYNFGRSPAPVPALTGD